MKNKIYKLLYLDAIETEIQRISLKSFSHYNYDELCDEKSRFNNTNLKFITVEINFPKLYENRYNFLNDYFQPRFKRLTN